MDDSSQTRIWERWGSSQSCSPFGGCGVMINVEAQTLPLNIGQAKAWGVVMTMIKGLVVFIILPPASFPFWIKTKTKSY